MESHQLPKFSTDMNAPGEEVPQAPVCAGCHPATNQLGRREPLDPGEKQFEQEPAMPPPEVGILYPELH